MTTIEHCGEADDEKTNAPMTNANPSVREALGSSLSLSSFEYRMPAEWEAHSACLILFPHNPDTFRVEKASAEILRLALAIATVGDEPVYLLCKDAQLAKEVTQQLLDEPPASSKPLLYTAICPSNDTWARDTGPTFVFRRPQSARSLENTTGPETINENPPATKSPTTPTTAQPENGSNCELIGLDWDFNAYGGPEEGCYWPCTDDRTIARLVCSETTAAHAVHRNNKISSNSSIAQSLSIHSSVSLPIILEGGSFHTDGEGTLLTTSECLLNPNRNPQLTRDKIEEILKQSLGVTRVLWLPFGLDADLDTNGHVDNFCCFVRPGHVLLAWTDCDTDEGDDDDDDENDENDDTNGNDTPGINNNYRRCRAAHEYLRSAKDARGRTIEITKLCLPTKALRYTLEEALSIGQTNETDRSSVEDDDASTEFVRYPGERMAASYVNFYIANKAVLVPQFAPRSDNDNDNDNDNDENDNDKDTNTRSLRETDRMALETLRPLFPGRTVVGIPSREILLGGGNIHCQTQQVPSIEQDEA